VPDPPLFPAGPDERAAVEDAERFGDEALQHPIRQLLWWGFRREKDNLRSYSEGARLGLPVGLAVKTGGPLVALSAHFNEATDANANAALVALPDDEGVLSMWAYHRTDPARRPAGANLRFECLEPFRRWHVTFAGRRPAYVSRYRSSTFASKRGLRRDVRVDPSRGASQTLASQVSFSCGRPCRPGRRARCAWRVADCPG